MRSLRLTVLRAIIAIIAIVALSVTAPAQDSTQRHYSVDHWNTDAGIPQNSVNAILQSRDGYLWLATLGGIARFDGTTFSTITTGDRTGLQSDRAVSLAEDRSGRIWIGTEDGLARYDHRVITTLTTTNGLPGNSIEIVAPHPDGSTWFATRQGAIGRVTPSGVTKVIPAHSRLGGVISALVVDSVGTVWVSSDSGIWRIDSPAAAPVFVLPRRTIRPIASPLLPMGHDGVWASTDSALVHLTRTASRAYPFPRSQPLDFWMVRGLAGDAGRALWLLTEAGTLWRFQPDAGTMEFVIDGLPLGIAMISDREGSVWIGDRVNGLTRVRRSLFQMYAEPEGIPYANTASIFVDSRDRVWVGAKCHGGTFVDQGRFQSVEKTRATACVYAFAEDTSGAIWLGGSGVARWKRGAVSPVGDRDTVFSGPVYSLLRDSRGTMWIGTQRGLFSWDGRTMKRAGTMPADDSLNIRTIVEGQGGSLWLGTLQGLRRYMGGAILTPAGSNALPARPIRAIREDGDGTLWIATYGGGLVLLRHGAATIFTTADGLTDNSLSSIHEDGAGNFWFSSNRGVFRVARQELEERAANQIARVHSVAYGQADGMASPETNGGYQSSVARTSDGRLWYPTLLGVAVINPATAANMVPPTVTLDRMLVNGEPQDPSDGLRIGPGASDVEIAYTGLSLNAPNAVTFRYRLDGWDRGWVDAGTQRSAHYSRLTPGPYRFRVMAANRDGVWGAEESTLGFAIVPHVWETWWFRSLAALALVAAFIAGFRVRLRQVRLEEQRNALEKQNEMLAENVRLKDDVERISRHDLRTPLTSIISLTQIIRESGLPPQHDASLALIEQAGYRVLNMANRTLDLFKMEQGTYRLTPRRIDILQVAERALTDLGALIRTRDVHCIITTQGFDGARPMIHGDELLSHSMLSNLVKNAVEASPPGATVTITFVAGERLRIRIQNQGAIPESLRNRFFEKYATGGKKGGTGLGAYSARLMAETQGGSISADTDAGRGTTITVELPSAPDFTEEFTASLAVAAPRARAGWPPRSVLIVDDDEQNRAILHHFLLHPAWTIDEAENGPLAVRKVAERSYDVVFMDVEMPVMDGLEAARRIRERLATTAGKRPVIVALSSHDDETTHDRALQAGCDAYLMKPVSRGAVTDIVLGDGTVAVGPVTLDAGIRDLVPGFLEKKRRDVASLAEVLASGATNEVTAAGHRLRGSFSLYGFHEAAMLCAEIEQLARQGNMKGAADRLPSLAEYLARVEVRYADTHSQEA